MSDIARKILEHFWRGRTLDDKEIAALYRVAHKLVPDAEVSAEEVKRWAFDEATNERLQGTTGSPFNGRS